MTESTAPAPKPAYKTATFWLSTLALLLSIAWGSGLIVDGSVADKAISFAAGVLTAMGFSVAKAKALAAGK